MSDKILDTHLSRTAFVYIRQSTQGQVVHNVESRRRQYALEQRAHDLGWSSVEIIDEDMGCSGSGITERKGFQRLVSSVGMGNAGAVFSLEASRLARNNKDWHCLIDICAMVKTLIIDQDGIYDAGMLNDRLLLGLKGTMSEFELNLFRQRSHEALLQKAKRGELYLNIPIGYVVSRDNKCEQDANERIRSAIQLVFDKFSEVGSIRQVMLWLRHEDIKVPCIAYGPEGKEVVWRPPVYTTIRGLLINPIYAGAYAFGKTITETYFENGHARRRTGKRVAQDKWHSFIKQHHQGYISWDTYERNQLVLAENANMKGLMSVKGAPREGKSLLAGLLRCGRCGKKMHVIYCGRKGAVIRYRCRGNDIHFRECCSAYGGWRVDAAVEEIILNVIQPASIDAAVRAAERIRNDGEEKQKSTELALQQAEYEVIRARRQYDAVDPQNRLVAGELERRWNEALLKEKECRDELLRSSIPEITKKPVSTEELENVARDLPLIWHDEATAMRTKKMIVRTLIKEIVVDTHADPGFVNLTIHWHGGSHTFLQVARGKTGKTRYTTDMKTLDIIRSLSRILTDSSIASTLNRLGSLTSHGHTWTEGRVASIRNRYTISIFDKNAVRDVVTMKEASMILGISPMSVHRLIKQGIIPAEQSIPYAPCIIKRKDLDRIDVRKAVENVGKKIPLPADANQEKLKF